MGYPTYPFVDYPSNSFGNLNNSPQIILETTSNTLFINSIIITNTTDSDIRINIKNQINTGSPIEQFLIYNFPIPSYRTVDFSKNYFNTMDLIQKLGLQLFLQYSSTLNEKLLCYSNGREQYFDCKVTYTLFNEIPPT